MDMEALSDDAGDWHGENYYSSSEVHTSSNRMIEAYLLFRCIRRHFCVLKGCIFPLELLQTYQYMFHVGDN